MRTSSSRSQCSTSTYSQDTRHLSYSSTLRGTTLTLRRSVSCSILLTESVFSRILNRTVIDGHSDLLRHDEESYKWVRVPRKLKYIDQTGEITATYAQDTELESPLTIEEIHEDGGPGKVPSPPVQAATDIQLATMTSSATFMTPSSYPLTTEILQTPDLSTAVQSHTAQEALSEDPSPQESCQHDVHSHFTVQRRISPPAGDAMRDTILGPTHAALPPTQMQESFSSPGKTITTPFAVSEIATPLSASSIPIRSNDFGGPYLQTKMQRLISGQEAQLMRSFVDSIAPSFDLCDRDRHFSLVVPQRALMCPILLNAVFAVSAKYLSAVSDFDPVVSDGQSQECLKHLIPKLCDAEAITDENILAATVILRHLEELES